MAGLFFYESETNAVETFSAGRRHDALLWFWLVNHCIRAPQQTWASGEPAQSRALHCLSVCALKRFPYHGLTPWFRVPDATSGKPVRLRRQSRQWAIVL